MLAIQSRRVVTPDGVRPARVVIAGGRIAAVEPHRSAGGAALDVGDLVVSPGSVDTHVHFNEPGRTEWEGLDSGTRAAAAGGVTTVVDMPLNSVPATVDVAGLEAKAAAIEGGAHVDVGLWGGVVPGNRGELGPLCRAGVLGFKAFLSPSGVDEFPHVEHDELAAAMQAIAALDRPLLVHAEDAEVLERPTAALMALPDGERRRHAAWLASRPAGAEVAAIAGLARGAAESRCHVHVVHLATAEALPTLATARAAGVPVTVETCPHYLTFAAGEIPDGGTAWKCAPPIRDAANREALWRALASGAIDLVASDHSPAPPAWKERGGDFALAWGGIPGVELALPAVWTGARERGLGLADVARWLAAAPAALAGIAERKGAIAEGRDADLVVWDPEATFTVEPARLQQRHKATPYAGRTFHGVVIATWVRGVVVWEDGRLQAPFAGRWIRR